MTANPHVSRITRPDLRFIEQAIIHNSQNPNLGNPIDVDPLNALLELVRLQAGQVAWLINKVRSLNESQLTHWTDDGEEKLTAWLHTLRDWQNDFARVCKITLDAGVEERLVRVAEKEGDWLVVTLDRVLEELQLTPEQEIRMPVIMARVIGELAPGNPLDPSQQFSRPQNAAVIDVDSYSDVTESEEKRNPQTGFTTF